MPTVTTTKTFNIAPNDLGVITYIYGYTYYAINPGGQYAPMKNITGYGGFGAYLRFSGVTIPENATVTEATIVAYWIEMFVTINVAAFSFTHRPTDPFTAWGTTNKSASSYRTVNTNALDYVNKDVDVSNIVDLLYRRNGPYDNSAIVFNIKSQQSPYTFGRLYLNQGNPKTPVLVIQYSYEPDPVDKTTYRFV
jgi:hypothetical protein